VNANDGDIRNDETHIHIIINIIVVIVIIIIVIKWSHIEDFRDGIIETLCIHIGPSVCLHLHSEVDIDEKVSFFDGTSTRVARPSQLLIVALASQHI
jgi:hypothetical protein